MKRYVSGLFGVTALVAAGMMTPMSSVSASPAFQPKAATGMTSCATLNLSPACKWPGPANTGVPAGTVLTKLTTKNIPQTATCKNNTLSGGELTIVCAGTTIDAMDIEEINVFVSAANVTFTRDRIQTHSYGQQDSNVILVDYNNSAAFLTMTDSTANGYGYQGNNYHVLAYGQYKLLRDNLFGGTDAILYDNGSTDIEDSWLHGAEACEAYMSPTSANQDCGIHADVVQKSEGSNDSLIHNTIESNHHSLTSGIQCCTDQGTVSNWKVEGNLFLTDGWQMYGGYPGQNLETKVVYTGNHFTLGRPDEKGPVVYANHPGYITWSGDIDDATGKAISN